VRANLMIFYVKPDGTNCENCKLKLWNTGTHK